MPIRRTRKSHKVDANQPEIVADLREMGVAVEVTSDIGGGFPDIICGYMGFNFLFEIKKDANEKLTPDEQKFTAYWLGQISTIFSAGHAMEIMKIYVENTD